MHFFLPNRVKLQTHLPKANIQYCGYFDVPWKKSENMQIHEYLTIVCAMWSSFLSKLFQTSLSYTLYNNKAQFHIIWLYFMSRKRTLKQSISAQCWGHPRDFEEQGNKAMYYRVTREDESKTRGPRVTTHSPEWHSYSRYAPVMQHFPILSLQLMKGWSIKQFLVLKKDTWPWQSMKRDHLDKLSIIFH